MNKQLTGKGTKKDILVSQVKSLSSSIIVGFFSVFHQLSRPIQIYHGLVS